MSLPRLVFCLCIAIATGCASVSPRDPVTLRIVAINDFHGHLESVASLATAIRELKAGQPHVVVVAAGDLVSAGPIESALFLDEPAVNALSEAGLEISSVGNHEFDRGRAELERLQRGGCSRPESCFDGTFAGARYTYLAANVIDTASGKPLFPAYTIRDYGGVRVAFVGAVLRGTAQIVLASGIRGLEFRDEAESVNALVPELRAKGIEAIVLLIHQGGHSSGAYDDPACPDFSGAIIGIVKRLDPAVDVVVSGHTHEAYTCRVAGRLVTSAGLYGRFVTAIDLTLDPQSREVAQARATNLAVDGRRYSPDARLDAYVRRVSALARERSSRAVGRIEGVFALEPAASGESSVGNLVADSQLAAMRAAAGAQVAFVNPGGVRAALGAQRPDGAVTYADLFSIEPFGNNLVAMTLNGAQLLRLLEQQWQVPAGTRPHVLHVSAGFRYEWDAAKPVGERVVPGSVRLAGVALDRDARYRVAVNSFLAGGGDGFSVFTEGADVAGGPLDIEALEDYLRGKPTVARPPEGRITRR